MDVLFINHRDMKHPQAGGAEEYIRQIGVRLVNRGYRVYMLVEKFAGLSSRESYDGIVYIRRGNFVTLYFHSALFVKRHGRRFDVIVDNNAHIFPFASTVFSSRPVVAIFHHIFGEVLRQAVPGYVYPFARLAEAVGPRLYRTIVVPSHSTKIALSRRGVDESRIHIVPPAVDHEVFRPGPKSPIPTVVWINRFVKYKRPDHAVLIFKRLRELVPEVRVFMVGHGPAFKEVKELARRIAPFIQFTGYIDISKKVKLLQEAWACLYTSTVEGFGLAVLEANACGTPCVGYDVPGLRDAIRHGETGLLVPYGDVEEAARALAKLLESWKAYSQRAVEYARSFSWEKSTDIFEKILTATARPNS